MARGIRRQMRLAKTHRAKLAVDPLVDILRSPARDILEEPDAADPAIVAEIEPMLHSTRDIDHVSTFDRDAKDRAVLGMEMKDPFALDSESDLVLRMGVLLVELREHRIEVRSVGIDVDDIGRQEAARGFDLVDLLRVLGEDLGVGSRRVQSSGNLPVFVPDPEGLEKCTDRFGVGDASVFGGDVNSGHGMEGSQMDGKRDKTPRDVPMVLEARLSIKVPAAGKVPAGKIQEGLARRLWGLRIGRSKRLENLSLFFRFLGRVTKRVTGMAILRV